MQAQTSHPETGHTAHAMPLWILVVVWLALMFLTYITVAVSYIDLGSMNMIVAMGVATLKASLVVLFFMHLLYDKPLNALVFVTALLFVALFIVIVLLDSVHYQPELIPGYAPGLRCFFWQGWSAFWRCACGRPGSPRKHRRFRWAYISVPR